MLWPLGEAWAYRRQAYKRMAEILGDQGIEAAPKMYEAVFAREPECSRAILQPKTPPMGQAALEALEAMESAKLLHWTGRKKPWLGDGLHQSAFSRHVGKAEVKSCCYRIHKRAQDAAANC